MLVVTGRAQTPGQPEGQQQRRGEEMEEADKELALIREQRDEAMCYAKELEREEADRSALRSAQASAELLYAQQKAELDAHEIRNSSRIPLQSIERRFAAGVEVLNVERRRLVSDHIQRTDVLTHQLPCATTAETSARLAVKANALEARLAAVAHGSQATEATNHIKRSMTEEAGHAIASHDAVIQELHQRLEVLAADAKRREEDILHQKASQVKTLYQQLEAAKGTANVAGERRLREMQTWTERAQAQLYDKDRHMQETMVTDRHATERGDL